MTRTQTVGAALADAAPRLRAGSSPTPRLDAEVLLAHATGHDRSWLFAHPEAEVALDGFEALLERRLAGEPIAYLRGFREWRSLRIRTDARALVPRPETEVLLDAAIDEVSSRLVRDDASIVVWEVGTGSGAVAVALALRFREALALGRLRLIASDVAPDALELAAENLEAAGVASLVDLACADLLAPAGTTLPRPDVVVANLPYVTTDELDAAGTWLTHEPRSALDGGPDGLDVIRRLLAAGGWAGGATLLLEIGAGQGADAAALAPAGMRAAIAADLAGRDRVASYHAGTHDR